MADEYNSPLTGQEVIFKFNNKVLDRVEDNNDGNYVGYFTSNVAGNVDLTVLSREMMNIMPKQYLWILK